MDRGEMDREQYESRVREMNANVREALAAKRRYVIGADGEGIAGTKVAAPVEEEGGG